jgi:hypothetical protein
VNTVSIAYRHEIAQRPSAADSIACFRKDLAIYAASSMELIRLNGILKMIPSSHPTIFQDPSRSTGL